MEIIQTDRNSLNYISKSTIILNTKDIKSSLVLFPHPKLSPFLRKPKIPTNSNSIIHTAEYSAPNDDLGTSQEKTVNSRQYPTGTSPWHPIESIDQTQEYNDAWLPSAGIQLQNIGHQYPSLIPRNNPPTSYYSKRRTITLALLSGLLLCSIIAIILIYTVHHNTIDTFDPTLGARGQKPIPSSGKPFPVLDVINSSIPDRNGTVYFGISIDWNSEDPEHVNTLLNSSAAIQTTTVYISNILNLTATVNSLGILHTVPDYLNWTGRLIGATGAIMAINLVPIGPLSETSISAFAKSCTTLNSVNISLMVRFAPEMNGNWFGYGQNPQEFIKDFRNISLAIKNSTIQSNIGSTAMVWSPAPAHGYPYGISDIDVTNPRFSTLDTNGDGLFNELDDGYLPYYPGDDVVDWVGLSAIYRGTPYNKESSSTTLAMSSTSTSSASSVTTSVSLPSPYWNTLPPTTISDSLFSPFSISFEQQLIGGKSNFYNDYVELKSKPLVLWDVGAAFYPNGQGINEITLKMAWLNQTLNGKVFEKYPMIKAVICDNREYYDIISKNNLADYRITNNTGLLNLLKSQVLPLEEFIYYKNYSLHTNTVLGLGSSIKRNDYV